MTEHDDPFALVRRRLLRQASIFDDPTAYAAGVEDALAALARPEARSDGHASSGSRGTEDRPASASSSPVRGAVG